jgi:hypothetical protein
MPVYLISGLELSEPKTEAMECSLSTLTLDGSKNWAITLSSCPETNVPDHVTVTAK